MSSARHAVHRDDNLTGLGNLPDFTPFHQLVLRLDKQDRAAVTSGMPAYAVYGLRYLAAELVRSAKVMYRGLRREGKLQQGFAFCGRLQKAFDNFLTDTKATVLSVDDVFKIAQFSLYRSRYQAGMSHDRETSCIWLLAEP